MNLPYDTSKYEIERLCSEFVPVDDVIIPRNVDGRPHGYAFVFVKSISDIPKLIDFVDGRHIRSRQIRAKISLGGPALAEELKKEAARKFDQ